MWSAIAISEPGPDLGAQRAGGVGDQQRLGAGVLERAHRARASRPGRRPRRRACGPAGTRPAARRGVPSTSRAAVAGDARLREARAGRRRRSATASSSASASPPRPEPRMIPSRGAKPGALGDDRVAVDSRAGTPGRRSAAAAPRASSSRARRSSAQQVDVGVERHELAQPLAAAAARHAGVLAVGDHRGLGDPRAARPRQRADRRRLGALALRVGGVLDVGADVDRAVLGAQRGADAVAASTARGRAPSRSRAAVDQRVGARRTWSE